MKLRNRVQLEIADLKEATRVIVENHYLKRGRTMAQLPYWILLDGRRIGVLLFAYPRMSATFHGFRPMNILDLARMWIGSETQDSKVVDRYGKEHAFSVASCAVGKALRRIRQDWHAKYPHLPDVYAVVSWADSEHHEGTIYKAANFREIGASGGTFHGRNRRVNGGTEKMHPDYLHVKKTFLFVYPGRLTEREKEQARLQRPVQLQLPSLVMS